MTIGQRIREKRRERDWTLKNLAEATQLSLPYLSDVERGRTQPSLKSLALIAQGLDITTTDLMAGADDLGEATSESLPVGLQELRDDKEWGAKLDNDWLHTLLRVEYRGRRPQTKEDWMMVFLSLRQVIGERER